ncbi:hypothetical protein ACFO3O_12750 [Dokdonia ponticola]|uniref:Uncharacterized protein n=1 Tax=Dokdonia ponticola TaxID=2041041 RepID=A0ABV9HY61_9FLAO
MKLILTTLFLVYLSTSALSQEYRLEIGTRTGCSGRGICTITSTPNPVDKTAKNTNNASIILAANGSTVLRVYREKLTQEELDHILGGPIPSKGKEASEFIMEEALPLPEEIIAITATDKSKQLSVLEAKIYPTVITDEYIDITILDPEKK